MDTITTIIVTAFINIAISSFLFYRYQKSIDLSFEKRLKEFESGLDFSLFQKQTIFSKIYPKTLEVLENYHQKLRHCNRLVSKHMYDSLGAALIGKPLEKTKRVELGNKIFQAQEDYSSYLDQNRLYIPDEVTDEINEIEERASMLALFARNLVEEPKRVNPQVIKILNLAEDSVDFTKPENINVAIMGKVYSELDDLSKQVEKIYKSAVQFKNNL